jgi:hypothetical protein
MEDLPYFKQAVAKAEERYDQALVEWKSASLGEKSDYKEIMVDAKEILQSAQESLRAFLETQRSPRAARLQPRCLPWSL